MPSPRMNAEDGRLETPELAAELTLAHPTSNKYQDQRQTLLRDSRFLSYTKVATK